MSKNDSTVTNEYSFSLRLRFYPLLVDFDLISSMFAINSDSEIMPTKLINVIESKVTLRNKLKNDGRSCAICGAQPTGINFNVLTVSQRYLYIYIIVFIMYSISFSVRHVKHFFDAMVLNLW